MDSCLRRNDRGSAGMTPFLTFYETITIDY